MPHQRRHDLHEHGAKGIFCLDRADDKTSSQKMGSYFYLFVTIRGSETGESKRERGFPEPQHFRKSSPLQL